MAAKRIAATERGNNKAAEDIKYAADPLEPKPYYQHRMGNDIIYLTEGNERGSDIQNNRG